MIPASRRQQIRALLHDVSALDAVTRLLGHVPSRVTAQYIGRTDEVAAAEHWARTDEGEAMA
ncbi:hypothetical protein ABZS96_21935 [Streptomyces avermitilis]|uniref:hypothetical protein n=1 Tax=Streptomyces avermitilis TaxID=33903 RepID=UPI00339DDC14